MSKVIQFKKEEEHSCPICDLVSEHIEDIANSESPEELFALLSNLAVEALHVGIDQGFQDGFDVGYKVGYKGALESDIEVKKEIVADIEAELDEEICHCDCEDCEI